MALSHPSPPRGPFRIPGHQQLQFELGGGGEKFNQISQEVVRLAVAWREEEEEEFFNHYKNDLKRHAHTPSGVAGAWDRHGSLVPRWT